jgi:transcriptional regulator with XRE-family HTH domain
VTPVQADAARAAGVSVFSWNRYEKGGTKVDAVALAKFCDAFDVAAEYVITGKLTGQPDPLLRLLAAAEAASVAETAAAEPPASLLSAAPPRSAARASRQPGRSPSGKERI